MDRNKSNGDKRKTRDISAMISLVLAAGLMTPKSARANEGHSHGEVDITSGRATAEVTISKKSQFLINLRTQPAHAEALNDALLSYGHIIAKPQLDSFVRAPVNGFFRAVGQKVWGTKVKKGELLARIEGLANVNITAPIAGTIMEISGIDGVRVEAGQALFRVVDTSVVWVDADVFQKDLISLQEANKATVAVEGNAHGLPGQVLGIKTSIDENTLSAKVYVELANPDGLLPLGSLAHVMFDLPKTSGNGIVLPKSAVLNRGGERLVYVQTGPETFIPKPVATRFGTQPETVIITSGLEEGDRVVVSGNYQLLIGAH